MSVYLLAPDDTDVLNNVQITQHHNSLEKLEFIENALRMPTTACATGDSCYSDKLISVTISHFKCYSLLFSIQLHLKKNLSQVELILNSLIPKYSMLLHWYH